MNKTETIAWHKYPDHKPLQSGYYLFAAIATGSFLVDLGYWDGSKWLDAFEFTANGCLIDNRYSLEIYAWTSIPSPPPFL